MGHCLLKKHLVRHGLEVVQERRFCWEDVETPEHPKSECIDIRTQYREHLGHAIILEAILATKVHKNSGTGKRKGKGKL